MTTRKVIDAKDRFTDLDQVQVISGDFPLDLHAMKVLVWAFLRRRKIRIELEHQPEGGWHAVLSTVIPARLIA